MFLFIGSVAYGQDLISVEVNTDKLVEFISKKDSMILKLSKDVKYLQYVNNKLKTESASKGALIDSMEMYKRRWLRVEKLLAPRLVKKLKHEVLQ